MMPYMMISQGVHDQIWYLNDSYRINWTSGSPVVEQIGQTSKDVEHVSTYTNSNGDVVLYSDGETLRNYLHHITPNGDDLLGSNSSSNSAIFVPSPSNLDQLYLFYTQGIESSSPQMLYSIIDLRADGGKGDIIEEYKNVKVLDGIGEYLTVTKGDCGSIWIISHSKVGNTFYSIRLGHNGIEEILNTSVGFSLVEEPFTTSAIGSLKINSQNTLIAFSSTADSISLFSFDSSTGRISNPILLPLTDGYIPSGGLAFSSSGSKLYVTESSSRRVPGAIEYDVHLYQYDLSVYNGSSIINSKALVGRPNVEISWFSFMQKGYDNKIYLTKRNSEFLGVINNPEELGQDCNYEDDGLFLEGLRQRRSRLPSFVVRADQVDIPQLDLVDSIVLCSYDTLSIELDTQRFDSLIWSDGYTGYDRKITDSGTYILSAYSQGCMEVDTINVSESEEISLPVDTVLCHSDSLVIDLSEYDDVVWSDGVTTAIRTINTAGLYGVSIIDETGCIVEESITIARAPRERSLLPTDTILCKGEQIKIISNESADTYLWSTGSTERFIEVLEGGMYTLDATYSDCTYRDSIIVYEMDCTPPQCHTYIPNGIHLSSRTGNNIFVVTSNCDMIDYSLNIYDRWGNEMYHSRDETQGWDGSYGDSPAMSGVYLYQLHYRHSPDEPIETATGTITLFR